MEWTPIVDCAYDADITVGTLSGDTYPITIQLKDFEGNNLTVPAGVMAYYADSATGIDPSALNSEIALTGSGDGAVLIHLTHYLYQLISEADGDIDITITDTGTTAQYLTLLMPDGRLVVSGSLGFA